MEIDEDTALAMATEALGRSASKSRDQGLEALAAVVEDLGFVETHISEITAIIFSSLDISLSPSQQRLINTALHTALESDAFMKEVAARLVKADKNPNPRVAFILFRWSGLVLRRLDSEQASKAAAKVIECQANWLDVLLASGRKWQTIQRVFNATLHAAPSLQTTYEQIAISKGSSCIAQALFLHKHPKSTPPPQALLTLYVDKVLSAKEKVPHQTLLCYKSILAAATEQQVAEILIPAAVRMTKRSPESSLPGVIFMLSSLTVDLSPYSNTDLLPTWLQQARHAKETVRKLTIDAAKAFASRLNDPDVLRAAVESATAVLSGKAEGKIKSVPERVALAQVIEALAAAPGRGSSIASAAMVAVDFACSFYKEEISEEGKVALISLIKAWLPRCQDLSAAAVQRFNEGLKEKEVLRRAHLRALNTVLAACPEFCSQAAKDLSDPLAQAALDGNTKAVLRVDGVLSLLCIARIAAADTVGDSAMKKVGVWDLLSKQGGGNLVAASTIAKFAPVDAAAGAELAGVLLTQHSERIGGLASEAAIAISRTLVLLCLHHNPETRSTAASSTSETSRTSPNHALLVLTALQYWLDHCHEVSVLHDPADPEAPIALEAVYERYMHGLFACLPSSRNDSAQQDEGNEGKAKVVLNAEVLANILMLSNHPMIASARSLRRRKSQTSKIAADVWTTSKARLGSSIVASLLESEPESILAFIFKQVESDDLERHEAACGALRSLANESASRYFEPFMSGIAPLLDTTAHDALTPKQLRIYGTPPSKLSNENEDGSIIPGEMFEELLLDRRNIQPPLFPPEAPSSSSSRKSQVLVNGSTASSSAAPKLSSGVAGKSGAAGRPSGGATRTGSKEGGEKKNAEAEARAKQLISEAEVRAGVVAVREGLAKGLRALAAFASGDQIFAGANLRVLGAPAVKLLSSSLVGSSAALECTFQLALCLPTALSWHAMDVACALRLIAIEESFSAAPNWQKLAGANCVIASIRAIQVATGGTVETEEQPATAGQNPLPSAAYSFCFPIVRAVMSCQQPTPLHKATLDIVALHVTPESPTSVPDPQNFGLLYKVLEILPAYRERVQKLLCLLGENIPCDNGHGQVPEATPAAIAAAFTGLEYGPKHVRCAALGALTCINVSLYSNNNSLNDQELALLWMARFDPDESNAEAAKALWDSHVVAAPCSRSLPADFISPLTLQLSNPHADVRIAAAAGIAAGLEQYPMELPRAVNTALDLWSSEKGRTQATRLGSAVALQMLAPSIATADNGSQLSTVMEFLLSKGLVDSDQAVRSGMLEAGVAVVDAGGSEKTNTLLPLLEGCLDKKKVAPGMGEEQYDHVRQGGVVLLGTLAKHLDPTNPKVRSIIDTLIEVLTTPSEAVQRAVSDRLPPLMQAMQGDANFVQGIVDRLLERALKGKSYGDRRGAGFGLAGVVKGLGISSLKAYGIMDSLKVGIEDKASAEAREGALSAFECLSEKLGRLFEPYVIHVLPMLLVCFGDTSPAVRDATDGAARTIMGQLSGQGVKLVLPALLKGVEDKAWRTKQGSIQLLGAMAHCAPKQLSTCLPTIVPRLSTVLSDPHPKVVVAAKQALEEVGSVIRNPEVSRLVPALLAAVADPNKSNKACLDTLLSTVFVNTVDAASLALIMPVIERGLRDRSGDVKKRAARIVGNLTSLVNDAKDMMPYMDTLLPELQAALIDPLPEVRATAARAFGALVGSMGEGPFAEMMPWLLEKLRSDGSAVERSGAAQGLAEVLSVQGNAGLDEIMPQILAGCRERSAAAREGHLTLFKYLPHTMPGAFQRHLPEVLPCVLDGLADEVEGVRDASLSAGRVAVELYANSALSLLLPAVEAGMANSNWRIRQSSVELLGDLLFKVAGTSGRIQQDLQNEEEEGISVEAHGKAIIEALGMERRNHVLSLVYVARSDVAYTVRTSALHVWKTIVTNTPKTMMEVLPTMMVQLIAGLADASEEPRLTAARCLGELVNKMGDRVLSQIVPILIDGLNAPEAATRQGVCCGLKEVMESATKHQLAEYLGLILPAVQGALCDDDANVRQAAGSVLSVLFKSGGGSAIESVIPSLLMGLEGNEEASSRALEGLRVVLGVKPTLLSAMVPKLMKPPLTATSVKAIGALAEVAGSAMHPNLPTVLPPLLTLASDHPDVSPAVAAAHETVNRVASSLQDDGVYSFVTEIIKGLEDPKRRRGAATALTALCKKCTQDFQEHVPSLLQAIVPLMAENDADILQVSWEALSALTATIPKETQPTFVHPLKEAVATAKERIRRRQAKEEASGVNTSAISNVILLPGFCLPKALTPVLPIYLQGVLQGSSAELREESAEGLGELVAATGEDTLKPFVVQITGPLIRIIGDKFPWQTKAAILKTMGVLIEKAGVGLRPFVPQLQTTFLKCLGDQARTVRQRAASNLGVLSKLAPRLDNLVTDLGNGAKTAEPVVQEAYLLAIQGALLESGDRLLPETLTKTGTVLEEVMSKAGEDEVVRAAAAGALGAYASRSGSGELSALLRSVGPLNSTISSSAKWGDKLGAALVAAAIAQYAGDQLEQSGQREAFVAAVAKLGKENNDAIKQAAGKAAGRVIRYELTHSEGGNSTASLPAFVPLFVSLLGIDQHTDVQRHAMAVLRRISGVSTSALQPHYPDLVPSICAVIQDTSGSTKLTAERTLAKVLGLDKGTEAASVLLASGNAGRAAKTLLTDAYMRRLGKMPGAEEEDAAYDV